jgi:hypothetical protein
VGIAESYKKHGYIGMGPPSKSYWSGRTHPNENIRLEGFDTPLTVLGGDWQNAVYKVTLSDANLKSAPAQQSMATSAGDRRVVSKNFNGRRITFTLSNYPGQGVNLTGDCCMPMPPPCFMCCCSDLHIGGEASAVSFVYDEPSGQFERPECCCQHLHVEWTNYSPGTKVLSFKCGICCTPDNERWDIMSDGTIVPRGKSGLVLGLISKDGGRTGLVARGDPNTLFFKELM